MPATDAIHDAVRNALRKDGWVITHDPLTLLYEELSVSIDLAGERLLAAERGTERIAVEIKTFAGKSRVRDFRDTLGQYELYRIVLEDVAPDRKLYTAISDVVFSQIFRLRAIQRVLAKRPMSLVVVDLTTEGGSAMDRVAVRAALDEIVRRVARAINCGPNSGLETVIITDSEHDQYGLLRVGWRVGNKERVTNIVFLARIKDGKVWIEEDNTDLTLADELLKAGVSKDDIVLAFHPPEIRHLGEFAVA